MKRILLISTILLLAVIMAVAQAPEMFKYQTVIRNNSSDVIKNQSVALRISILKGSATGTSVYNETHKKTTNEFGLINLEIGGGTVVSGTMDAIDWSTGSYFVKVELDANNGTNFTSMGASQLLSVPYSLYSEKSGDGFSGSFNDLTDKPILVSVTKAPLAGDILFYNGTNWDLLPKGENGKMLRLDNGLPNWGEPGYALPIVTTVAVTDIMTATAKSGGNIISTGFTTLTASGVCWATTQNPTTENSKTTDGTVIGTFNSSIADLQPNTTYYVRAYATNSAGTTYGNQISFKTYQTVIFPTVTTATVVNITKTGATGGGNVTATGGAEVIERGVCWSLYQNPTVDDNKSNGGTGTGEFACSITNLEPGKTYYVKAYATHSAGTGYGSQLNFKTTSSITVVATKEITNVNENTAIANGFVIADGGSNVTERGVCFSSFSNPTITDNKIVCGTGTGNFNCALNTLTPNTIYYVRAYAINNNGIVYGENKSFKTVDSYYIGFENGMPSGWIGNWIVSTNSPYEGFYCLSSDNFNDSIKVSITITNLNGGQVTFFHRSQNGIIWSQQTKFYIDNILQTTMTDDEQSWTIHTFYIAQGVHILKWINKGENDIYQSNTTYIDYLICPK